jgi:hypothetical protein
MVGDHLGPGAVHVEQHTHDGDADDAAEVAHGRADAGSRPGESQPDGRHRSTLGCGRGESEPDPQQHHRWYQLLGCGQIDPAENGEPQQT